MKSVRICHVSTVHRGVEIRIIRKELASLAQAGYEAHAIISATPEEVAEAARLGITIHPLNERPGSGRLSRMTRKMFDAWRACRRLNARLYHFHDPELIPLGMLLKLFGYHVVMDVHEDLANQILTKAWIPKPVRRLVSHVARTAERVGARIFDGVVIVSPGQAGYFQDVAKRLITAHNYPLLGELTIETPAASPHETDGKDAARHANSPTGGTQAHAINTDQAADAPTASATTSTQGRTHVVYVGGISRIRGINEAIKATEQAKVQLILAGKFKTEAEKQEAASLSGWQQVEYLGWVERAGIQQAMARSFAGLCTLYPVPNHVNALPIKLFEYMAAGIPAIISNIPTWMPYVEKHDAGLCVDPMDVDAIAEAIAFLRDNPERARQMGENGRRAVLEHYNWDTQAEHVKQLYREILST